MSILATFLCHVKMSTYDILPDLKDRWCCQPKTSEFIIIENKLFVIFLIFFVHEYATIITLHMWGGCGGKCIQRFLENQIHLHRKWDWPSLFWYIFIDLGAVKYFGCSSLHATIRDWAADQDSLKALQRAVSLFNSLHDIWKILRSDITRVAPNSMFIYQMSESFEGEKLMTNRHLWDLRCLLLLINCLHVVWHLVIFY